MDTRVIMAGGIEPEHRGSRKRLIIVVVILLVAVLSAGVAYGYLELDLFKSAKQVYLETEAKNLQQMSESAGGLYDQYYTENVQPYLENSVHDRYEIVAGLSGALPQAPSLTTFLDLLKNSKLVAETYSDVKNQQSDVKLDLAVGGSNLIGGEYFADKEKIGLGVPVIYNKYGVVYLKDRDKFKQRFGNVNIPKRFISPAEWINAVKVSQQEYEPILQEYAKLYMDSLTDQQVVITKGTFEEGQSNIPSKIITVSFTPDQFKALVNKFADKIASDDKLADLLYAKYTTVIKLYQDQGNDDVAKQLGISDKTDLKQKLKDLAANLKKDVNSSGQRGGLKDIRMVLYVDSNHSILERQITPLDENEAAHGPSLELAGWVDKDKKEHRLVTLKSGDAGPESEFDLDYSAKQAGNSNKGNLAVTIKDSFNGKENSLQFSSDFTVTKDGNKTDTNLTYNANLQQQGETDKVSGSASTSAATNAKDKSRDSQTDIKADVIDANKQPISIDLSLKRRVEFGGAVPMPKVDAGNSVDLANMSNQDVLALQRDIQLGLGQFILKNRMIFANSSL